MLCTAARCIPCLSNCYRIADVCACIVDNLSAKFVLHKLKFTNTSTLACMRMRDKRFVLTREKLASEVIFFFSFLKEKQKLLPTTRCDTASEP